jgi:uncharacterized protein
MADFYLKDNRYLYLSDSNRIVNAEIYDLCIKYASNTKVEWEDVRIDEDIIKYKVRQLEQIIFEASQFCNMRCSYCIYSGSYFYQRKNSSKSLSFATAKRTIDYIRRFIYERPKKEIVVGFYGGEPLSNFDVIEEIVDYSKQVFPGWKLRFTITTNGTLLNERIIRFLIAKGISLMVSLDGNEKNHDAKRVFQDGRGTFRKIMENMKKIKDIDNDYYLERVHYFITYSKDLPINDIFYFFINDNRVNKNSITLNFVNHLDTDYYDKYPYDKVASNSEINKLVKTITDKKLYGKALFPIEENLFNQIVNMEKKTKKRRISFLAESCLFEKRLYVATNGTFHICEKMNDQFPFGDCNQGFDFSRMTQIAQEFMELIKQKCLDCEVRFLCSRCYIHFAKNGKFEINPDFCNLDKRAIKKLENIIELKEKGVL